MSSEEHPQGETALKKNKFHFFKRKGTSKSSPNNIKKEVLTSETHSVLNVNEQNVSREKLLDPNDFLSPAEYVQPTNKDSATAVNFHSAQEIEEVRKNAILNERSINSRSFKKLMHSFKGTKTFVSRKKKEGVNQKEGTIFSIFSGENETDKNGCLMIDSTKELNDFKSSAQNNLNVSKTSKNSLDTNIYGRSQTFAKKEDNTFFSNIPKIDKEERSNYIQLATAGPCNYTPQSQEDKAISNKIMITEKMGISIINIYNTLAKEKDLPILNTSAIGDISEELIEKVYILLQSSLTDYSDKCVNFQKLIYKKEETIKMLEINLSKLEQQLITSNSNDTFLNDKRMSKKETHKNTKTVKPSEHQITTPPCSEYSNKKDDHIYNSLKNLETKYDQLYNAYGCLENESQQVKNQSILLVFYRDKSIKFLESLYQLFEGLIHKNCLIKYQTCLKELTSNYYLHKTGTILGPQIESVKSEINYFFDEIAKDILMKKAAIKLSSLTNKTKILEEQLHKFVGTVPSRGNKNTELKTTKQYDL